MVGAARRSALAATGSRIALKNELCQELNRMPLQDTMISRHREEATIHGEGQLEQNVE